MSSPLTPIEIPESEYELVAIRASGPGGQNVNKVATAIQLRFDVQASSLSEGIKARLLEMNDHRISVEGVVMIKANEFRSQVKNREEAVRRLLEMVEKAAKPIKKRKPTRPTRSAQEKRLNEKARRSEAKSNRGKVDW